MNVNIRPGRARGIAAAPPSKSCAHRALICAALAREESTLRGIAESQDILATLDCLGALGAQAVRRGDALVVRAGDSVPPDARFPCRESGSTLRFFLPLSLVRGQGGVFTGTPRLMERGIGVYETLFAQRGIAVEKGQDTLRLSGTLPAGEYVLRGDVSSQFVTGMLLALSLLPQESTLRLREPVESRAYIDMTLDAMETFGVFVERPEKNTFRIPGAQRYRGRQVSVEGDWSNAAFLYALNHVGGAVEVTGLSEESRQGDRVCRQALERLASPGAVIDLSDCPDLGPVLFAAAAASHGATFTGTRRLQIKESDRARAMAQELEAFGIRVQVEENEAQVFPGTLHAPKRVLRGHNDHRIVMALSVLCTVTGGEIQDAEAVGKSWPEFFSVLRLLGVEVQGGI